MLKKILVYAGLVGAGIAGTKAYDTLTREKQEFYTVRRGDQTYLVDNEAEIPLFRVNAKPQLGTRVYRLEGLLEEERVRERGE